MAALTAEQLGALQAAGRDPSQREQVLASRNLLPTEYMAPNYLTYGNAVSFGENADVGLYPGKQYVLYDNKTGSVLASGSTPEELNSIINTINTQLVPQGGNADWRLLDMGGSPTTGALDMHTMLPSGFGEPIKVGDQYGIPIAGDRPNSFIKDMLIPMLTPIAATAGAYFGGNALLGAQGGGAAPLAGVSNATVSSNVANAINAAYTGAQAGAAASLAPVYGSALSGTALGAGTGGLLSEGVSLAPQALSSLPQNLAAIEAGAQSALASAGLGAGATGAGSLAGDIIVTAQKPLTLGTIGPLTPVTQLPELLQSLANTVPPITPEAPPPTSEVGPIDTVKEPGFLDKVTSALRPSDYLKLASLGISTIGGLLGGGGGSGATYTGAGTALNPRFSAKLPSPTLPGASSNFAARPAAQINTVNGQPRDWTQYGFGPEASFFDYVPQRGYAYGGDVSRDEPNRSFAVEGPGDGRSDEIPAMLSDGEYVMDAETVALLGNGSPKAGAQVLDEFRVNVRKHKGQKLAKGEFSVNAKKPERYLAGGRI